MLRSGKKNYFLGPATKLLLGFLVLELLRSGKAYLGMRSFSIFAQVMDKFWPTICFHEHSLFGKSVSRGGCISRGEACLGEKV